MTRLTTTGVALVFCCCLQVACGDSPTQPSQPAPAPADPTATATLGVRVVTNNAGPLERVEVGLQTTPGGAALTALTNAAGLVEWRVVPGRRYSVLIDGQLSITQALVEADAQWLISMPSSYPCRCRR